MKHWFIGFGNLARAIYVWLKRNAQYEFAYTSLEKDFDEENDHEDDDMKDSNTPKTKNPMKALLYQTMARGQRNLGELSLSLINFKKSKEFDEYNIELVEELDLEIQEIENMIKNQKPVFGERYIMKGSNIDNIRADHSETMTKMKFPVEFTNDSPVLRSKISPEELESIMSGRIRVSGRGSGTRGWGWVGCRFKIRERVRVGGESKVV